MLYYACVCTHTHTHTHTHTLENCQRDWRRKSLDPTQSKGREKEVTPDSNPGPGDKVAAYCLNCRAMGP